MGKFRFPIALTMIVFLTASAGTQPVRTWLGIDVLREGVPASQTRVQIYAQNIDKVRCSLYHIAPEQFLQYVTNRQYYLGYAFSHETSRLRRALPEPKGTLVKEWQSQLTARGGREGRDAHYSRVVFLPEVQSGIYYLRVSAGEKWQGQFVMVSRMGCVAKFGADGVLLYTYDYEKGQPLPNVQLTLFDQRRQPFQEARTGHDGIARLSASEVRGASALLARRGEDVLFHYLSD